MCVTVEEVRVNSTPLVISLVGQLASNITKPTGVRIFLQNQRSPQEVQNLPRPIFRPIELSYFF